MIKNIITSFCLFLAVSTFAQEGSSSPYSYFGIGEVKFKGTVENRSMGGLSLLCDSIHLNMENPASYSHLKLTSFAIGTNNNQNKIQSDVQSETVKRFSLDYLAVGLPIGKLGASFGVIPYSAVGYKIQKTDLIRYNGTGGLNKVYAGLGYSITKALSIGINFDYNFGKITTQSSEFISDVELGTIEANTSIIKGTNFTFAMAFKDKISKKLELSASVSYSPESQLNVNNNRSISTLSYGGSVTETNDAILSKLTLNFSEKTTMGIAIGQPKKWLIGTEYHFRKSSNFSNVFNDPLTNVRFENGSKWSFGGYYIPKYNSFTSYLDRIVYRGGLKFENTGLMINNQSIKDQSVSLGFGLPLPGYTSNLNIGLELGTKGTTTAGLVKENYFNISIGVSFNDKWFQKRKYD